MVLKLKYFGLCLKLVKNNFLIFLHRTLSISPFEQDADHEQCIPKLPQCAGGIQTIFTDS